MTNRARPAAPAVYDDWLAVSTEGFAGMNAGRDPAHLVKELVQNSLDAVGDEGGEVALECRRGEREGTVLVTCRDDGCGMDNLHDIRTVFYTSKTDSHLKRGRMGRGFKEMLCLATWATVSSGRGRIAFHIESGRRVTNLEPLAARDAVRGTLVQMEMPWEAGVIERLEAYFQTLLPPVGVRLTVNGVRITHREPAYRVEASLPTELFEAGRWVRPPRRTVVELVPVRTGEEPAVYELGIPVCPAEWTQPYHLNVLQRVPMNPCRDAVASGYLGRLHRACLPTLLPQMPPEEVRQDWVGNAVTQCGDDVQKEVIRLGFGNNIARSVPKMGVRQYDEDAREIGVEVVDTKQTSGGFREVLQRHVPTTKEAVDHRNRELLAAAAGSSFGVEDAYKAGEAAAAHRRKLIDAAGGKEHVVRVMEFARWFCQRLLDGYGGVSVCSVTLAVLKPVGAIATWAEGDVLTLGIDTPWLWTDPLGEESLATYVHEVAHHLNAHHGRDFHREVERLAGRAARVMLLQGEFVRRQYPQLFNPRP
jgi:Histidine kinase-, DNA gyrase B-, and HSP90-like ATPase